MSITLSRKAIVVTVAAGLLTVGAAGTVSYAAGSSKSNVTACVGKKNQLGVPSAKGKCAKGYKKVSIAKQGPRGATGKTGAAGKAGVAGPKGAPGTQGAQGPGAVTISRLDFGNDTSSTTVDGLTYTTTCEVVGTGANRTVTATLSVSAVDQSSVLLDGVTFTGDDNNPTSTVRHSLGSSASASQFANSGQASTLRMPSAIVSNNFTTQLATLKMTANPAENLIQIRCGFTLVATPTG